MELVSTYVAAGALIGVAPATVRTWVSRGRLTPGPWTVEQLEAAAAAPRSPRGRPRGKVESMHGTDSRYGAGCRCELCTQAHTVASNTRRAELRTAWWATRQRELLRLVAAGRSLADAAAQVGANIQGVTRHRRADPDFARLLDEALVKGRDRTLPHGTWGGWAGGCRCPDCRAWHEDSRGPRTPTTLNTSRSS